MRCPSHLHGVAVDLGPNVLGTGGFARVTPAPCVAPQCAPGLSKLLPGQRTLGRPPSPAPPHTQRHPRSLGSVQGAANPGRSDRSGLEPALPTPGMIYPQAWLPWSAARRAGMSRPLRVFLTFQAPSGEALPFGQSSSSSTKLTLYYRPQCTLSARPDRPEMEGKTEGK